LEVRLYSSGPKYFYARMSVRVEIFRGKAIVQGQNFWRQGYSSRQEFFGGKAIYRSGSKCFGGKDIVQGKTFLCKAICQGGNISEARL
jgi:hypothetical protein